MSKKKNYEYRDNSYRGDSDGLKQRRLKEENRWKFNPNKDYSEYENEDQDIYDEDEEHPR